MITEQIGAVVMRVVNFSLSVILSLGLATASIATLAAKKEAYKWVDDAGTIHYSAYPPKDRPSEKVNTHMGRSSSPVPQAAARQVADDSTEANKTPAAAGGNPPQSRKDPQACERAKTNLDIMKRHARVRVKGEDGELRYLSEEEKQQEIREAEQAIKDVC